MVSPRNDVSSVEKKKVKGLFIVKSVACVAGVSRAGAKKKKKGEGGRGRGEEETLARKRKFFLGSLSWEPG